jgi:hypothetical protein
MPVDDAWDKSDVVDTEEEQPPRPKRSSMQPMPPPAPRKSLAPQAIAAPLKLPPESSPKPVDSSLQLLARDLMPPARAVEAPPEIPMNFDRTVRALPPWTRAWRWLSHTTRLDRLSRKQKWIAGGAALVLVIGIVAAMASRSEPTASPATGRPVADIAKTAHGLVAKGKYGDGLASYEAVLIARPSSATDKELIADLGRVADKADAATATTALDMLAVQGGGPGHEALLARTTSKSAEVRHLAVALAESEGIGDRVDHVASWTVDLQQTTNCDQKREILAKIAAAHDKRAGALQARYACASQDAKPAATSQTTTKKSTAQTPHHRPKPKW